MPRYLLNNVLRILTQYQRSFILVPASSINELEGYSFQKLLKFQWLMFDFNSFFWTKVATIQSIGRLGVVNKGYSAECHQCRR